MASIMTTEREEALELAREAGFWGQTWDKNYEESFIRLVRLAKQRGAEEQKRKDEYLRLYLHGSCTEVDCTLCKTSHYMREPHMRHAGIAFCDMG